MSDSILSPFAGTDANGGNGGTSTVTAATSSAAIALGQGGGRYSFTAYTTEALIRFGISTVGAASSTAFGLDVPIGATRYADLPASITHFTVISTGAGSLRWGKVRNSIP